MKKYVLDHCMNFVQKNNPEYSHDKLAEIHYGLESIYILITKTVFIFTIALLLNVLKEVLIFTLLYNLIRMPSFGLHATKSWICLLASSIIFIGIPFLSSRLFLPVSVRSILGAITILFIYKNAPADTYKRPIIDQKRRHAFKLVSTLVAIFMSAISISIPDGFLANSLVLTLVVQSFMISPLIYRIFHLPYNNYKNYLLENNSLMV